MHILKHAMAGSLESSDILVEVSPGRGGLDIELASIVMNQYGDEIQRVLKDELDRLGVAAATVRVNDHGALECVIRARVETAVRRAAEEGAK